MIKLIYNFLSIVSLNFDIDLWSENVDVLKQARQDRIKLTFKPVIDQNYLKFLNSV